MTRALISFSYSTVFALAISLSTKTTFASETMSSASGSVVPHESIYSLSGRGRTSLRLIEKGDHDDLLSRWQLRLDGTLNITPDGCIKLNARIAGGSGYNSENMVAGIFDGEENLDINVRRIYVDMKCISENVRLEAGAMPARSFGHLGLSQDGWVDGLRVIVDAKDQKRKIYFTLGEISDLKNPNAFSRDHSGLNYGQLELEQGLADKTILLSVSHFDDSTQSGC